MGPGIQRLRDENKRAVYTSRNYNNNGTLRGFRFTTNHLFEEKIESLCFK